MISKTLDKMIENMKEDCENIDRLYGEWSCVYCKNYNRCEAIDKLLKIKEGCEINNLEKEKLNEDNTSVGNELYGDCQDSSAIS